MGFYYLFTIDEEDTLNVEEELNSGKLSTKTYEKYKDMMHCGRVKTINRDLDKFHVIEKTNNYWILKNGRHAYKFVKEYDGRIRVYYRVWLLFLECIQNIKKLQGPC